MARRRSPPRTRLVGDRMPIDRTALEAVAKRYAKTASKPGKSSKRIWNPFAALFTRDRKPSAAVAIAPSAHPTPVLETSSPVASSGLTSVQPPVPQSANAAQSKQIAATHTANTSRPSSSSERVTANEERIRCARIIEAGIASGQINMASAIAFKSDIDADTAVTAIELAKQDRQDAARTNSRSALR
jgi:hypothetical protein